MSLKLYYDLLSQPSRAVLIFLKANNIAFEPKPVALRKGEQLSDNYKLINKFHTVPAIDDNGFKLMESVAILRYLARENPVSDFWVPNDNKKLAKIDEYLEWQHHNTRFLCNFYVQRKYLTPLRTGKQTEQHLIDEAYDRMISCMDQIENIWLENNKFIGGSDISIADLLAACELEGTRIAGYDPRKDYPKISAWMDRVRTKLNPHYDEAHSLVYKLIEKLKGKK